LDVKGSNIYNVGTGIETDVNTLFRSLKNLLDPSCREEHAPAKAGEQMRSVVSAQKIQNELGWKPKVMLAEGLKKTAEYFKAKVGRTT